MRIALVSDYEVFGGAAVATSRLAQGLCEQGHEVWRIVARPEPAIRPWRTTPLNPCEPTLLQRQILRFHPHRDRLKRRWDRRSVASRLRLRLNDIRADVIHFHNIHGGETIGWSVEMVAVCAEFAPVVWTLHDCWSFTGRCAYAESCRMFLDGCTAACPTAREYPAAWPPEIPRLWASKQSVFHSLGNRLVGVSPSNWLAGEARSGFWKSHRLEIISYGLDAQVFAPVPRDVARAVLRLPPATPVVLFAAHGLADRRKGGALFAAALESLPETPTVLAMGEEALPVRLGKVTVRNLGFLKDDIGKVLAYSAADFLIHSSIADNLPNVVLEALACGTPVVGFDVGGVPDMVLPMQTGLLAKVGDSHDLADKIVWMMDHPKERNEMGANARRLVEERFTLTRQAKDYVALYSSLIHVGRR